MNKSLYQKNIQQLAQKNLPTAKLIDATSFDSQFEVFEGPKTTVSVTIKEKQESVLLHSKHNPEKEAKVFIDNQQISNMTSLVILGFGFGYHILELLRRPASRDFILIVEQKPWLVKLAFHYIDFSEIFQQKKVFWLLGEGPEKIPALLRDQSIPLLANGLAVVTHPSSEKLSPKYYQSIKKAMNDFYVYVKVNVNTQIERSQDFVGNAFKNLNEFVHARPVGELFGIAKGMPVFVVAAGPSLDKTVSLLEEIGDRGYIIAVDSAIRTLLAHNVHPDFVISIDFTQHALKYFTEVETRELSLVFDLEVYPEIVQSFQGTKYAIHLPKKSVSDFVTRIIGDKGQIEKGLSVSHAALLLAQKMEASQIVLVGQDLAYPKSQWHTKGSSFFQNLEVTEEKRLHLQDTVDIFGGKVKSSTPLLVFKNHFEMMLDQQQMTAPCYDATEGGVPIRGTKLISLKDAIVRFCLKDDQKRKFSQTPKWEDHVAADKRVENDFNKLSEVFRKMHTKLERLNHQAVVVAKLLGEAEEHFQTTRDRRALANTFTQVKAASKMLESEQEIFDLMKDSATEALILREKKVSLSPYLDIMKASEDEILTRIRKEFMFLNVLIRSSDFIARQIEGFLNHASITTHSGY